MVQPSRLHQKQAGRLHHNHQLPTIVTANLGGWRQVGRIHESLVSRMDVPLKLALPSKRDYRAEDRRAGCAGQAGAAGPTRREP